MKLNWWLFPEENLAVVTYFEGLVWLIMLTHIWTVLRTHAAQSPLWLLPCWSTYPIFVRWNQDYTIKAHIIGGALHDDGIKKIKVILITKAIQNFWTRCITIFFFRQLFSELTVIYCIQWPKHYSYVYPSPYSSFSLPSFSRIANGLAERSTCSTLLNSKIQTQGTFYVGKAPFRNS